MQTETESERQARTAIAVDLERRFGSSFGTLHGLPGLVVEVESYIEDCVNALVLDIFGQLLGHEHPKVGQFIASGSAIFRISCAFDPIAPDRFVISVLALANDRDDVKARRRSRAVSGYGRIRTVEIVGPADMAEVQDSALSVSVGALESGYTWIAQHINELVERADVSVAPGLYKELRAIIPELDLRRNVWFAMVGERNGFRLMDPDVASKAYNEIDQSSKDMRADTLHLVSEIFSASRDRSGLLMNSALSEAKLIDGQITEAQYWKDSDPYAVAMYALYGSKSFAILPILNTPRKSVLVLFPTGETVVRDRLLASTERLKEICLENEGATDRALALFDRSAVETAGLPGPLHRVLRRKSGAPGASPDVAAVLREIAQR